MAKNTTNASRPMPDPSTRVAILGRGTLEWGLAISVALLMMLGRWSMDRLFPQSDSSAAPFWLELRTWVLVLALAFLLSIKFSRVQGTGILLCFLLYFLYGLATVAFVATPCNPEYAARKTFEFAAYVGVVIGFWAVAQDQRIRDKFYAALFALAIMLAALGLWSVLSGSLYRAVLESDGGQAYRMAVLGGGPNVFIRFMGIVAVLSLYLMLTHRVRLVRTIAAFLFIIGLGLAVQTGSRGGLAAVLLSLVVVVIASRRLLSGLPLILVGAGAAAVVVIQFGLLPDELLELTLKRLVEDTFVNLYYSDRDVLLYRSLEIWSFMPLTGVGLGQFTCYTDELYAHNVFLEVLAETGAIGFLLFFGGVAAAFYRAYRNWTLKSIDVRALGLLVLYFAASQFSGDLFDSRGVILFAFMAAIAARGNQAHGKNIARQVRA